MSGTEIFERALRAAAGVTGVLKRGAAVGVAATALAGCSAPAARPAPSNLPESEVASDSAIDAGAPDARTCPEGWGSQCCEEAQAAHENVAGCMAWGPPAPPSYRGEALA